MLGGGRLVLQHAYRGGGGKAEAQHTVNPSAAQGTHTLNPSAAQGTHTVNPSASQGTRTVNPSAAVCQNKSQQVWEVEGYARWTAFTLVDTRESSWTQSWTRTGP